MGEHLPLAIVPSLLDHGSFGVDGGFVERLLGNKQEQFHSFPGEQTLDPFWYFHKCL